MADKDRMVSASKLVIMLAKRFRNKGMVHYDDLKAAIADVPTVDAVEVVRCKDCKYYDRKNEDCNHPVLWFEYCSDCGLGMKPDDFCSYGERRDNGN